MNKTRKKRSLKRTLLLLTRLLIVNVCAILWLNITAIHMFNTDNVQQEAVPVEVINVNIDSVEIVNEIQVAPVIIVEVSEDANKQIPQEPQILEIYKDVDEYLLAQLVECEARGTGDLNELMYVGKTALNRMTCKEGYFRNVNTLEAVIWHDGQYATPTLEKISAGIVPTELSLKAAHLLLIGEPLYYQDENGIWQVFGSEIMWQTGDKLDCNVETVFVTEYHYYSKLAD